MKNINKAKNRIRRGGMVRKNENQRQKEGGEQFSKNRFVKT